MGLSDKVKDVIAVITVLFPDVSFGRLASHWVGDVIFVFVVTKAVAYV